MKKILFLSDNLGSGGAQRQMVTIARILKQNGYSVTFRCYNDGDFNEELLLEDYIQVDRLNCNNYIRRLFFVRNYIRRGRFDVVISFLETPNFLNDFAAIGGKKWKVITSERSAKLSTFKSKRGRFFAWFQRYSDIIVCNSENAKTMWGNYYPTYKNKLCTIYNSVILPQISSQYIIRKDNKIHIIVAASYQYLKNPINVIEALNKLEKKYQSQIEIDWYGRKEVTMGNTKCYDDCCNLIKMYNLQDVIHLNDETKDIANKMVESDCVALFSQVEGLPNVICEGMMIGKPIIMTRVSDFKNLVDHTNGLLCDWDDINSIKNTLCQIIKMSNVDLKRMGLYSQKKAELLFSPNKIVKQWISIIE